MDSQDSLSEVEEIARRLQGVGDLLHTIHVELDDVQVRLDRAVDSLAEVLCLEEQFNGIASN